jgi:hypothetical protein
MSNCLPISPLTSQHDDGCFIRGVRVRRRLFPLEGALTPAALQEALWPVLIGAALALALRHWGRRLPRAPEGDIVVLEEAAFRATFTLGARLEQADAQLRQWPTASLALLAIAIILGAAMLTRL